ncbi:hypothetical protein Tco_0611810 [Tanacetum coccineum]
MAGRKMSNHESLLVKLSKNHTWQLRKAQGMVNFCTTCSHIESTAAQATDCHAGNSCELIMIQGLKMKIQSLDEWMAKIDRSIEPTVTLFRVFQTLCKQGDWFSFAKRHAQSSVCIDNNPIVDPKHVAGSYRMADVRHLSAHVVKLRDMPEGVLVLSGLSRVRKSQTCDPLLRDTDGNVMAPILLYSPAAVDVVVPDPTRGDIAASNPSAKRTRSDVAQSSGSTTRPNLFADDAGLESDDDDDACYEIPIVTPIRSAVVIPPSENQSGGSVAPAAEGPNTQDSQGKGIMTNTDAADAPSLVLVVRGSPLVLHLLSESFLEMPFIEILLGFRFM